MQVFRKGQLIAVQGSIQTRTYTDKDGNKRKAVEIVADNVHFAEPKRDNSQSVMMGNGYHSRPEMLFSSLLPPMQAVMPMILKRSPQTMICPSDLFLH